MGQAGFAGSTRLGNYCVVAGQAGVAGHLKSGNKVTMAAQCGVMRDIPDIKTDSNWGLMLGQFKWVYAFASPLGGFIADRFSRRLTVCASLFLWSLVTWWTGRVESFQELMYARTLMGLSEAFYIPAALALIADNVVSLRA